VNNNTCNICAPGCLVCTGIGACTICDTLNFFALVNGSCPCITGRFDQNGSCVPCGAMAGCTACNTAGCTQCEPLFGFHLNSTVCQCSYGYFINSMNVCEQCQMLACLNCISQPVCTQCNTTYFYLNSSSICDDICGDGIRIYVQCDDGNLINGDGCSSTCYAEQDYTCTGGSWTTADVCSYSGPFYITVLKTYKDPNQNKVDVVVSITPNIQSLANMNFSSTITPNFTYVSCNASFNPSKGQITFAFVYN
jgi:cysteine-rich repeat protein